MRVREGKPRYSLDCYHCVLTVGLHNQLLFLPNRNIGNPKLFLQGSREY